MVSRKAAEEKRKLKLAKKREEEEEEESSDADLVDQQDDVSQEEDSSEEEAEEEAIKEESAKSDSDGHDDDDDDDEMEENEESGDDDEEEEEDVGPVEIKPIASANGEQCTFDLQNLLAVNTHQIDVSMLYSKKKASDGNDITIPAENLSVAINEDHLLEKATDGCMQLINALWQLPTERSDAGPLINLPGFSETKLPRQLPPPPPKKDTKWEKFAKERGIPLNKSKRSQKVWDEATSSWLYRHGYNKANDDSKTWPIMEVGGNDDPFEDPWERMRDAKKSRVDKNMVNRMRNEERAGNLPKGTSNRTLKSMAKNRKSGRSGDDGDKPLPVGLPVDLESRKGSAEIKSLKRGRENTQKALLATQRSTASLGKFDAVREGEPERKKAMAGLKKRRFESATDKKVITTEADRGMKLLNTVINGGGAAREKAKRKGHLAKGETAYDYEFNDGLGPSTFKKKKGRAGAGKLKKMTKKRVT